MSKIQSIQNALIAINETVFQDLCDCFLISINRDYTAYSRTGSQTGKQKTRKGTPDSCFRLRNGKFVFVECSTNISLGVSKLKSDIEKCLDTDKTGISIENIAKIILCFNFNIKSDEIQILNDVLQGQNIDLELYSLDALSLELSLYHRNLANEFLGIPFDSGQVVSIDRKNKILPLHQKRKMSYRFMRLLVFFDLPTETGEDRRNYRRFRQCLIKNGFMMLQESVYCRMLITPTAERAVMDVIRKNKPPAGTVQMLSITEKQFNKMEYLVGEYHSEIVDSDERLVIL